MALLEVFLFALGLAADAFAVSVCKGLSARQIKPVHYLCVGLWFGGAQALMPLLGYYLGMTFEQYITSFDHWIAFTLLLLIGANMIRESFSKKEEEQTASFSFKSMLLLALATSIDALAVGVTYALSDQKISIWIAALIIGAVTFLLSAGGLKIGRIFGARLGKRAEMIGGIVLILLGVKILLSHLGVLPF